MHNIFKKKLVKETTEEMISAINHEEIKIMDKLKNLHTDSKDFKTQLVKKTMQEIMKNQLEEKLSSLRKEKSSELNKLVKVKVAIKYLTTKKLKVTGPIEKIFQNSFKEMKLRDEVYFKETTFVGNTVHKILKAFSDGNYQLLECFKDHPDLYNKYLDVWLILAEAHKNLSKPGEKSLAEREQTARSCEKFTEVFPLKFKRPLTRKMHVFSAVLPKHIRDKGLYYEFLCLEQAGEKAHARFNKGEVIWANIRSEEERFFKIMKYVKNADMCDMTIFNSAKTKYYKK